MCASALGSGAALEKFRAGGGEPGRRSADHRRSHTPAARTRIATVHGAARRLRGGDARGLDRPGVDAARRRARARWRRSIDPGAGPRAARQAGRSASTQATPLVELHPGAGARLDEARALLARGRHNQRRRTAAGSRSSTGSWRDIDADTRPRASRNPPRMSNRSLRLAAAAIGARARPARRTWRRMCSIRRLQGASASCASSPSWPPSPPTCAPSTGGRWAGASRCSCCWRCSS